LGELGGLFDAGAARPALGQARLQRSVRQVPLALRSTFWLVAPLRHCDSSAIGAIGAAGDFSGLASGLATEPGFASSSLEPTRPASIPA